jgi:predicted MPP superfamily phosphohydrolase
MWSYIESLSIEVRHVYVKDPLFEGVHKNITIAQISDLHIGKSDRQVGRILTTLQSLKVDTIVLTGDYVKWNGDYESALNVLAQLKANKGVYAVMGDYDYSNSRKSCLFCHEQGSGKTTKRHSVRFLRNSCDETAAGNDRMLICGIDGRQAD